MKLPQKWIWLPEKEYPHSQRTVYSGFAAEKGDNYTVAEFKKRYTFKKNVVSLYMIFSGDTEFRIFCNDKPVATGPTPPAGDFLGNDKPRPDFYYMAKEMELNTKTVDFFAEVKMMPVRIFEYSKGHGGFMLSALITFDDGTEQVVTTDSTWLVRKNEAYKSLCEFDSRVKTHEYINAEETEDIWHAKKAPIKVRCEETISPKNNCIKLKPHEEKEVLLQLDKIEAGFVEVFAETKGDLYADVLCREINETGASEHLVFGQNCKYRGFKLHSVGNFLIELKNDSDSESVFKINLISTHYPVNEIAEITTSDTDLNKVIDVCRHTLKICRQLHHLDSPRHCEPLACTGDYYIETLMTLFSFGDMSLAEFDIRRTATLLRNNDGRIFHTTYSLIWVRMLYDVYMFTGHRELLVDCKDALIMLLNRFDGYVGDNGLIENPPDYMFIDWIYIDEISMHHPPKALGQTCLNMFYYGALDKAAEIFYTLSEDAMADECNNKKMNLRNSINSLLFDKERGLYFEGLNTKTPENLIYQYMPQNVDKRYYMKHSNILSVCFGVCEKEQETNIIDKVMTEDLGDVQPYFMHYLLEAVFNSGLREKYTLQIIEQWKKPVLECDKGLVEGFVKHEPDYSFDHSHAWGGTPLYSLPKALLGLKIDKAGLSEISLNPSLLGLSFAKVELPTPYGKVVCDMKQDGGCVVNSPDGVKVNLPEF